MLARFFPTSFLILGGYLVYGRLASLCSSSLEAYTGEEIIMRYKLKMRSKFLLIKDEFTDVLYICSAIRPFLLV